MKTADWPNTSDGAWVLNQIKEYLALRLKDQTPDEWLDTPLGIFGGRNAPEFVQVIVDRGAQSYTDAWQEVFGIVRRCWESN